jgi:hypothetical protein
MIGTRRSFVRTGSGAPVALAFAGCRGGDEVAARDTLIFHKETCLCQIRL